MPTCYRGALVAVDKRVGLQDYWREAPGGCYQIQRGNLRQRRTSGGVGGTGGGTSGQVQGAKVGDLPWATRRRWTSG